MSGLEIFHYFLAGCGAVSIVGGAVTVIARAINPALKLKTRMDEIEKDQNACKTEITEIKELQAGTIRALVAIIDHEITGNHVDGLRKTKDDIMKLITEG